jgi:acyl carrier protein
MTLNTNTEADVSISQKLQQIFLDTLQRTELPTGSIQESLDSVDRLALMVAVEDHFEIMFDLEEEEQIKTVEDFVSLIKTKIEDVE